MVLCDAQITIWEAFLEDEKLIEETENLRLVSIITGLMMMAWRNLRLLTL